MTISRERIKRRILLKDVAYSMTTTRGLINIDKTDKNFFNFIENTLY